MPASAARKMIVLKPNSFHTSLKIIVNRNQITVTQEEDRLYAKHIRQELVDKSGLGKHIDQNAGERNPGKKVRQIDERLDAIF